MNSTLFLILLVNFLLAFIHRELRASQLFMGAPCASNTVTSEECTMNTWQRTVHLLNVLALLVIRSVASEKYTSTLVNLPYCVCLWPIYVWQI